MYFRTYWFPDTLRIFPLYSSFFPHTFVFSPFNSILIPHVRNSLTVRNWVFDSIEILFYDHNYSRAFSVQKVKRKKLSQPKISEIHVNRHHNGTKESVSLTKGKQAEMKKIKWRNEEDKNQQFRRPYEFSQLTLVPYIEGSTFFVTFVTWNINLWYFGLYHDPLVFFSQQSNPHNVLFHIFFYFFFIFYVFLPCFIELWPAHRVRQGILKDWKHRHTQYTNLQSWSIPRELV